MMRPCLTIVAEIVIRSDCSVGEEFAEARALHRGDKSRRRVPIVPARLWQLARQSSAAHGYTLEALQGATGTRRRCRARVGVVFALRKAGADWCDVAALLHRSRATVQQIGVRKAA